MCIYIQHFHNLVLKNNDINKHLIYTIYSLDQSRTRRWDLTLFLEEILLFTLELLSDGFFAWPFVSTIQPCIWNKRKNINTYIYIHLKINKKLIYTYSEDIFRSSSYVCSDKFTNVVSTQVITWFLPQIPLYEKKIILIISHVNWSTIYN